MKISASFEIFPRKIWFNLVIGAVLISLAFFYLYKIEIFPRHDYDETSFLNIPYRFVKFGDNLYPVFLSDSFNSATVRKYPPPLTFWLRNIFHYLVGFSDKSSRIFSAFLTLSTVVVAGVVALSRVISIRWLTLLPLFLIGFHPSVTQAARSVRIEEEVNFLGIISIFGLPLLLEFPRQQWIRLLLWSLSGVLAGWAALSHPWGVIFPTVLLLSLLMHRQTWAQVDELQLWRRLLSWFSGLGIPLVITAVPILRDWSNYRAYTSAMSILYSIRDTQSSELLSRDLPWLKQYLPGRFVAQLSSLQLAGFFNFSDYSYPVFFKILFWIELLVVVIYTGLLFVQKPYRYQVLIPCATWLALLFTAFTFFYPPNTNYYLYPAFTVPLAFIYVSADLFQKKISTHSLYRKFIWLIPGFVLILGTIGTIHFSFDQIVWLTQKVDQGKPISLDTKFETITSMVSKVSLDRQTSPIYGDLITWIAGGRHQKSLLELTHTNSISIPESVGGVVFELQLFEALLDYPSIGSHQLTPYNKVERMGLLLKSLNLAGVIFAPTVDREYYFYAPQYSHPPAIQIALIKTEGNVVWASTEATLSNKICSNSSQQVCFWANLSPGNYLLIVSGKEIINRELRLSVAHFDGQDDFEQIIRPDSIQQYAAKALLVTVQNQGAKVSLSLNEAVPSVQSPPDLALLKLTQFQP